MKSSHSWDPKSRPCLYPPPSLLSGTSICVLQIFYPNSGDWLSPCSAALVSHSHSRSFLLSHEFASPTAQAVYLLPSSSASSMAQSRQQKSSIPNEETESASGFSNLPTP
jgi:hypothetical protein